MSSLGVIGGISAVITIIDACVKVYDGAQKDLKLPEAFNVVAHQLPILSDTLQTCKHHLEPRKSSIPPDVCSTLEKTLDNGEKKAGRLQTIFENVITQEGDGWNTRYRKIVNRFGKGNTVEELMKGITEDVQHIVNNDAVRSAQPEQTQQLNSILQELQSLKPSLIGEDSSSIHTQNNNYGDGQLFMNENMSGTQNFHWVQLKEDFSFVKSIGICLDQAPYMDHTLFIGRDSEQDQIAEILRPNEESVEQRRLVLGGMGGIGKTQLAIAYAKRHSTAYESVFWLNAMSEATLKTSFRAMAERIFELKDHRMLSSEQALVHVKRWLSDTKNTQWLLIYDNYDDPTSYDIQSYYPYATHGTIIITTRLPDQVSGRDFSVQPLDHIDHSLRILETRSQRSNVAANIHARRLAERMAGLPLALATAGAYLHKSTWSFQRYLEEYVKKWNINSRRPLQLREYQDRTLYTTWNLSYQRLEQEDAKAAQLLKLLAYFDHQAIWEELFQAGVQDDLPEWLVAIASDSAEFESAMRVLVDYCFLEVQITTQSYSMHTCIHDWSLAGLNNPVESWSYWYAFNCVANSIDKEEWECLGYRRYARLAAHATRLIHSRFHEVGQEVTDGRLSRVAYVGKLLTEQMQFDAAMVMYMRALAGMEKALEPDHKLTLETVKKLVILYRDQGKLEEGEEIYMRALAEKEQALAPDHKLTLETVNYLGNMYRDHGKLAEAEEMYMQALAEKEKVLGSDHKSTLETVNNLGIVYRDQGKRTEAEEMFIRALAGREKVLGPDHISTIETVNNLGILYRDQGKFAEAEKMFIRGLARMGKVLRPGHISTLKTVNDLGILYRDQSQAGRGRRDVLDHGRRRSLGT